MARTYGKLLAAAWIDEDWTNLRAREQWLYMLLLSQPKLTLVGCIDYRPAHWAKLADGIDVPAVIAAVEGLEAANYVAVDRDTDELLIRSFTKHDGIATANYKLRKGLWGAWVQVMSADLRAVAVRNMPAELFDDDTPEAAWRIRRSDDQERAMHWSTDRAIGSSNDRRPEPPSSLSLHPEAVAESDARSDHRLPEETVALGFSGVAGARDALKARAAMNGAA